MIDWAQAGPYFIAAFLASLVEFVEAMTIILAVGTTRGWRPALLGAAAGTVLLVQVSLIEVVVCGVIALHDEALIFDEETRQLRGAGAVAIAGVDIIGFITTFKAVVLEGLEVVFIVIAIGAGGGMLLPASLGAGLALIIVTGLGLALHRPLARVPENALKFTVGVLITTFGVFWIGEGLGLAWPGEDWALLWLALVIFAVSLAAVRRLRGSRGARA